MKKCVKVRKACTVEKEEDRHMCVNYCFEDCMECDIKVKKKRTVCTHMYEVACKINVDEILCVKPCTKIMECGHRCKNKCCEPCGNCKEQVSIYGCC